MTAGETSTADVVLPGRIRPKSVADTQATHCVSRVERRQCSSRNHSCCAVGGSRMKILAVDPGKMTGWALYLDGSITFGETEHFEFVRGAEYWCNIVDQVICENFIITAQTAKNSPATWSLRQIGCIEFWCWKNSVPLKLQNTADAKSFATNERLKNIGWYTRGGGGHANDAARHLLLYCAGKQWYNGKIIAIPEGAPRDNP